MAEVGDGDLADLSGIAGEMDAAVDNARLAVASADVCESDAPPVAVGPCAVSSAGWSR